MSQLLGALFAIMIGIMSLPTYLQYQKLSNLNVQASSVAQQAVQFNTAVSAYVQANSTNIQATATATTPFVISVATLQAAGFLPSTFSATNIYGQTWVASALQPTAGNLSVLAMTTGGTSQNDAILSKIASGIGANGGFIPNNDSGLYAGTPATAFGAFAGWTAPTGSYSSTSSPISRGQIASLLTYNGGQLVDNRLYRNSVAGQPQLNTMSTPIIMSSVQTTGGACTTNGAIAQDGTGKPLNCVANVWTAASAQYWKESVSTMNNSMPTMNNGLPTTGNSVGDGRLTRDTNKPYIWTGTSWQELFSIGSNSLSIGKLSGSGTTNISNAFIGVSAGRSNTTGNENAFVGSFAGFANTTGQRNSITGSQAGFLNTSGSRNTFEGFSAGYNNLTGSDITLVGHRADIGIDGLSNASAFGSGAIVYASNSVRIGNSSVTSIGGQVGWSNLSDRRMKEAIQDSVRGLDFVRKLRPVDYKLKENHKAETGFIAQEVEALDPQFPGVNKPANANSYYSLTYTDFIPSMVKAIQTLDRKVYWLELVASVLSLLVVVLIGLVFCLMRSHRRMLAA